MSIIRLATAYLILTSLSVFFLDNIKNSDVGGGYSYLVIFIIGFLFLFLMTKNYRVFHRLKLSFFPLILFVIYLSFNILYDSLDLNELKKSTIGTTSGLVFAIVLGLVSSYTLAVIYELSKRSVFIYKLSLILAVTLLTFVLLYSAGILIFKLENVRDDLFLIAKGDDTYQRPAALIFMQFILVSSLVSVLSLISSNSLARYLLYLLIGLVSSIAVLFMMTSQLIGSNSGLVTVCGFLLVWYTFLLVTKPNLDAIARLKKISISTVLFSFIGKKVIFYFLLSIVLIMGLGVSILAFTEIKAEQIRIMGFGSGSVSSVDSRIELIKSNFIEHLSYSPIFGNTRVDSLTTGEGTYIHSIFSILTHLGLIGWLIFLTMLFFVYRDIKNSTDSNFDLYSNKSYKLFRLFSVSCVLVFALFSAFFTWMPFWFCLGLLGVSFIHRNVNNTSAQH